MVVVVVVMTAAAAMMIMTTTTMTMFLLLHVFLHSSSSPSHSFAFFFPTASHQALSAFLLVSVLRAEYCIVMFSTVNIRHVNMKVTQVTAFELPGTRSRHSNDQ